jgi:hypothetical protein
MHERGPVGDGLAVMEPVDDTQGVGKGAWHCRLHIIKLGIGRPQPVRNTAAPFYSCACSKARIERYCAPWPSMQMFWIDKIPFREPLAFKSLHN